MIDSLLSSSRLFTIWIALPTDAFAASLAAIVGNANAGRAACGSAADDAGCAAADARILGSKKPVAARGRTLGYVA
eukprot:5569948-Prymnesium_polylepis.1